MPQKCFNCGQGGHIARVCPKGTMGPYASRTPPPGRGLNMAGIPPVKCYRCGGLNHMAKDCLAPLGVDEDDPSPNLEAETVAPEPAPELAPEPAPEPAPWPARRAKTCFKCQQEGHISRDCPQNQDNDWNTDANNVWPDIEEDDIWTAPDPKREWPEF
ncbi:hypothetical protein FA95DRAFT_1231325 [Auriscalpium vulgare]|uniref:Uncharacterized protein n=1 Tax=Auriscalpium vulgare TaxID=40419 RepID=A0ACB8RUR2_9AGAM|nr:hypothetical protein FA95DRAFT_1231325 [Auriscalpium vulgare]